MTNYEGNCILSLLYVFSLATRLQFSFGNQRQIAINSLLSVSRSLANLLAPVGQTGKNLYPVHGAIGFRTTHPLNRGLSGGAIALIHRLNNRSQVAGSMHDLQKQCQSVFCATVRCLPFIIFFLQNNI